MNRDEERLQQHLQETFRVHGLSYNQEIRDGYAKWQTFTQAEYQQDSSELLKLCVAYVETLQSALPISEYQIHYVEIAQKIVNLYRDDIEQRPQIMAVLQRLLQEGESYFVRPTTFNKYLAKGMFDLVGILERTQKLWDLNYLYHDGEFKFSVGLLALLDRYMALFDPYQALNYDERELLTKSLQLDIVQQHPEEILNLFLFAIQHDAYFHYWVSKHLFFILMEQKDKRLNRPEILEKLLQNFDLIIKKMIYAKPFILHLAFSIEKIAKAQQLNHAIVDAMVQISFTKYSTQSIAMRRLEQIQHKVKDLATEFQQQATASSSQTEDVKYQLPLSALTPCRTFYPAVPLVWADILQQQFDAFDAQKKQDWQRFWQHIDNVSAKKPSQKWLKKAEDILHSSINENYVQDVSGWMTLIEQNSPRNMRVFDSKNENTLKGMLWFLLLFPAQDNVIALLSRAVQMGYRKIAGIGANSTNVANVAIYVLLQHGDVGIQALQALKKRLPYDIAQNAIQKALDSVA